MSPHPVKDIDMDRKEELIMAKQLRAARVTILPRVVNSSYVAKKAPKPVPPPTPKPQPKSIAKAQNPVALRYWSQCMALSTQTEMELPTEMNIPIVKQENAQTQNSDPSTPPWALSDTHLSPNLPNPSVNAEVHGKQKFGIKVPNINKQIKQDSNTSKRTDWAKILAEEDEHLEKHRKFKLNQTQRINIEKPSFLRRQQPTTSQHSVPMSVKSETKIEIAEKSIIDKERSFKKISTESKCNVPEKKEQQNVIKVTRTAKDETKCEEAKNTTTIETIEKDQSLKHKYEKTNGSLRNEEHKDQQIPLPVAKRNDMKLQTWDWKSKQAENNLNKGCSCQKSPQKFQSIDEHTDISTFVEDLVPRLNKTQIKQLGMFCFDKLSADVKNDLVGQHLSTVNVFELSQFLNLIKEEVLGESLSNINPKWSTSSESSFSETSLSDKDDMIVSGPLTDHGNEQQILNSDISPLIKNISEQMIIDDNSSDNQIAETDNNVDLSEEIKENNHTTYDIKTCIDDEIEMASGDEIITGNSSSQIQRIQINEMKQESKEEKSPEEIILTELMDSSCANDTHLSDDIIVDEVEEDILDNEEEFSTNRNEDNLEIGKYEGENYASDTDNLNLKSNELTSNKCFNEQKNDDILYNDIEDEKEEYVDSKDEENTQTEITQIVSEDEINQNNGISDSETNLAASDDESWEYEWEEEDDNEYEYYEQEDEEYKTQTFDGSFSVALK